MSTLFNMGHDVGLVHNMPFNDYYAIKKEQLVRLSKLIDDSKYKYLAAITANKYQEKAREVLAKKGFKQVVTFYSSHNHKDETLTLWTKTNLKKTNNIPYDRDEDNFPYNCSVNFNESLYDRLALVAAKKSNNDYGKNFQRVGRTPIFYKVRKTKVVKGIFD